MKRIFIILWISVIILCLLYSILFIRVYRISGDSMHPNLKHKTIILTDTLLPHIWILKRANIILYKFWDEIRAKRIIGVPWENIILRDGNIYINSALISEPYLDSKIKTCAPWSCIDLTEKTYSVPEKSYFVLGDNRENSRDSRGCLDALSCDENAIYYVPQSNIIGKYILALPSF